MFKIHYALLIIVVEVFALFSCTTATDVNINSEQNERGTPFFYSKDRRGRIIIQVNLNDSIPGTFVFDSGWKEYLILKSSFAEKFLEKNPATSIFPIQSGFNEGFYFLSEIRDTVTISIGGTNIVFSKYCIVEDESPLGMILENYDGIFPIPKDIHDLSISFSHKRISIDTFTGFDSFDYSTSLYQTKGNTYAFKEFPLFITGQADVIVYDSVIIDTGYRGDMCHNGKIQNKEILEMLKSFNPFRVISDNHDTEFYCLRDENLINRDFWVEYNFVDSGKYTVNNTIVGLEFLKSFDIFMDFERDSVYLKKIEYVSLLDDTDSAGAPIVAGRLGTDDFFTVMYIKSNSIYDVNGIMPKDVIISVNNKHFSEYRDSIMNNTFLDTLNITVNRNNFIHNFRLLPVR